MATISQHMQRPTRKTMSQRGRILRDNLTAYLFISPALVLVFTFGIYPVAFAFFVSLHRWRRFPDEYQGLANYVRGLGDFAYVLFFWLALGALIYAGFQLRALWRVGTAPGGRLRALSALVPGAAIAAALLLFIQWLTILAPIILDIPQRIRGQERVQGLFVSELIASFQLPVATAAGGQFLAGAVVALILGALWLLWMRSATRPGVAAALDYERALFLGTLVVLFGAMGGLMMQLVVSEVQAAVAGAQVERTSLTIGTQIVLISAGVALLGAAWLLWRRAVKLEGDRTFIFTAVAAVLMAGGGMLLITVLPVALAEADPEALRGLGITAMFALATVPVQLAVGLLLAVLLFQNIRGRSFFRVVYFLPYVMPFVATSIVFNLLFSFRPSSPANQVLALFGIPQQQWLLEPTGILRLIFPSVPAALAGPSLALIVIIFYTVWTYIGYDAVVFLAGLGTISPELYEAARIDGANEWTLFRHITLPLLSPTTFFLTLIAITGSFRAFTQIWIMRNPASQSSVDTLGVHIFETVRSNNPNMGYGSALAFVLFGVILVLTIVQNRVTRDQVYYGG